MNILVTGGAGFIGSEMVRFLIDQTEHRVLNVDKLTYAGNPDSLASVASHPRYELIRADISEAGTMQQVFDDFAPDTVIHLAAESHVDRSISGPAEFIQTNIVGTYTLLEAGRQYWTGLGQEKRSRFRFLHVSTDEVYGDLSDTDAPFTETTAYDPSSPYSASKASSDHLVRAWHRTYQFPILITNCSNNYGPFQFPEKLIPVMVLNARRGKPLPVYGDGSQIRDWLYVSDHVKALYHAARFGKPGETYNIGGHNEIKNIEVVNVICALLEELAPEKPPGVVRYHDLISFVADRPGHDIRYAVDSRKIQQLGWRPQESFASGIRKTVQWYLENMKWYSRIEDGSYQTTATDSTL